MAPVLLTATSARAAKPVEPDAFLVPPDSIRVHVDRIALVPVIMVGATWLPQPDSALAPLLRARLEAAGHSVVPVDSVLECWRASTNQVGGIFDRRSGRPDTTRVRAAVAVFVVRLRDSLGVGTLWTYCLEVRSAEWKDGRAKWDGVEFKVGAPGLVSTLLLGEQGGSIPALSLLAEPRDLGLRTIYRRRTGVASLRTMVKDQWLAVPESAVIADTSATRPAVDRVLDPWLTRMRVGGTGAGP